MNKEFLTQAHDERSRLSQLPDVKKYLALTRFIQAHEGIKEDEPVITLVESKDSIPAAPIKAKRRRIPKERKQEAINLIRNLAKARKSDRKIARELAMIGLHTSSTNVCNIRRANKIPAGGDMPIEAVIARWGAREGSR